MTATRLPLSDSDLLRHRGFRPIKPGPNDAFFASRAEGWDYDHATADATLWIRRSWRRRGQHPPSVLVPCAAIDRTTFSSPGTYSFLGQYLQTKYAEGQRQLSTQFPAVELPATDLLTFAPFEFFDALTKAITLSSPDHLHKLLTRFILPAFFATDPLGIVQVISLDPTSDRYFGFLRGGYALQHYSVDQIKSAEMRAATLRQWDTAVPTDYLDTALSILQVCRYPYIQLFHGGPFGLAFVFLFSVPREHLPGVFPTSWLHWARSDADFGRQTSNLDAVLAQDPAENDRLSHRRHSSTAPIPQATFHEFLLWVVGRLDHLVLELSDPANFETDCFIDFTFALENSLSVLRLMRRTLHALSTEEPPSGKLLAFEVADLIDQLSHVFANTQDTEVFKLLFNPSRAPHFLKPALESVPVTVRSLIASLIDSLYAELRQTVLRSVWIADKVRPNGNILVKTPDLRSEREEEPGEFIGNRNRSGRG